MKAAICLVVMTLALGALYLLTDSKDAQAPFAGDAGNRPIDPKRLIGSIPPLRKDTQIGKPPTGEKRIGPPDSEKVESEPSVRTEDAATPMSGPFALPAQEPLPPEFEEAPDVIERKIENKVKAILSSLQGGAKSGEDQ